MENLPVVLIVTSKNCGPCQALRGVDGVPQKPNKNTPPMIYKNHKWDTEFFTKLLKGDTESSEKLFRVYELFVDKNAPGGIYKNIISFAEFDFDSKGNLIRNLITHEGEEITHTVEKNGVRMSTKKLPKNDKTMGFSDFISTRVPRAIEKYARWFPFWGYIEGSNYNGSVAQENDLYVNFPNMKLVKNSHGFYVLPDNIGEYIKIASDPLEYVNQVANEQITLGPVEEEQPKKEPEVVVMKTGNVCGMYPKIFPYEK